MSREHGQSKPPILFSRVNGKNNDSKHDDGTQKKEVKLTGPEYILFKKFPYNNPIGAGDDRPSCGPIT